MIRLEQLETPLPGLVLIQRHPHTDSRGCFERLFCDTEVHALLGGKRLKQVNRSLTSKRSTVRGLHFQLAPHSEAKIVTCLAGAVFDVAVDLRRNSPTFLRWYGRDLTSDNNLSLFIPEGFAHGFQALTEDCCLLYLHTGAYVPESEAGFNVHDASLGIAWPLPVGEISDRDQRLPLIPSQFEGLYI